MLILCIALGLLFIYWLERRRRHAQFWKHIWKIPGPKGIPIIGTHYRIFTEKELWLRDRLNAKKFYPLFKLWCFDIVVVFVICPDDIKKILNSKVHINKSFIYDFFKDWIGDGLFVTNATKWHKRRKLLTPAYHFNILQKSVDAFSTETERLIDRLNEDCHKPYLNVVDLAKDFAMCCVGETSVGLPVRDHKNYEKYKKAAKDYLELQVAKAANPLVLVPALYKWTWIYRKSLEVISILQEFSSSVLAEKKQRIKEDKQYFEKEKSLGLLDLLLKAREDGADIDDTGIREEVDTFIFAGHDTTATSLSFILFALGNEPDIQERIYEETVNTLGDSETPTFNQLKDLKYLERCIKEALRLYPVAHTISRKAGEDIKTMNGCVIPKGCMIYVDIFDVHRRPEIWEDPEKFDPDRFLPEATAKRSPFAYIPFSAGSRNCIGQKYAILELKVVLCGIIRHFILKSEKRPDEIELSADIFLKVKDRTLNVKFIPRTKH
ncbi:cytochrome P450 4C1-like isoform X2 [Diabrotica virgifera virgifera]|uniref:Cytochrome P450 4C1-like n=1 Tax=Diabrotica virgifera virgifera TaxID=50390 RepID=A0ABM5JVU7_DIAVI|nr:cytochrome P450 4C1-like isoform X1 [Diabrotica virgifera virgifera]XP_050502064.1 cytochrome P450 4C1-like isoform X2 [Diabrotica virgifera virgifera]